MHLLVRNRLHMALHMMRWMRRNDCGAEDLLPLRLLLCLLSLLCLDVVLEVLLLILLLLLLLLMMLKRSMSWLLLLTHSSG